MCLFFSFNYKLQNGLLSLFRVDQQTTLPNHSLLHFHSLQLFLHLLLLQSLEGIQHIATNSESSLLHLRHAITHQETLQTSLLRLQVLHTLLLNLLQDAFVHLLVRGHLLVLHSSQSLLHTSDILLRESLHLTQHGIHGGNTTVGSVNSSVGLAGSAGIVVDELDQVTESAISTVVTRLSLDEDL